MPLAKNRRMQMMPSEFSIDFEIYWVVQNIPKLFLKSCDVDYGGKICHLLKIVQTLINCTSIRCGTSVQSIRHYPNGVTMTLTFQEILNRRRRYTNRVSAYAMVNPKI